MRPPRRGAFFGGTLSHTPARQTLSMSRKRCGEIARIFGTQHGVIRAHLPSCRSAKRLSIGPWCGALQGAPMEARTCGHIALTLKRPSENRVINRRGVTCGDATSVLDVLRGRPPGGNTYAGVRTRDSFVSPGNVGHVCAPGVMTACVGVRRHGKVSPGGHSGWRLTVWAKRRGGPHRPPPSAALPGRLTASLGKSSKSLGNYFHRSADQAAIQQLLSRATAPRTQSVSQMGSQRHHWLQAIAGADSLRPLIPR